MNVKEIITDDEVARVHGRANFGDVSPREVIAIGVLKCASGFWSGSTSRAICLEHRLIDENYQLTAKGRSYLWAAWSGRKAEVGT